MKSFLKNIVLFSLFAATFYVSFLFFWSLYTPKFLKPNLNYKLGSYGHLNSRLKEVKKIKNVDLLFLGSSHAYRGFDTRIFLKENFKSFNLGSSAQTPIQTEVLLNKYLELLNPKVVIYEVYPLTFSIDGVESSLDLIANDKIDLNTIQMAFKIKHLKTFNTLIYGYLRETFNLNKSFNEAKKIKDDVYISGGFVEKELKFFKKTIQPKSEIVFSDNQIEAFEDVISILKKRKIKLILVFAPVSKSLYSSYTNVKVFDDKMKGYAKYYNFNKLLNLNDTLHFYDSHHLNQDGVVLFNKKLIETIDLK
jgi:hypothetical protein